MDRNALRAAIEAASNPKPVAVTVAGLGTVYVTVQTAYSADLARAQLEKHKADDHLDTGRSLATVLCDENGELLFDVTNNSDTLLLSKLPTPAISAIFKAANSANSVQVVDGDTPGKA